MIGRRSSLVGPSVKSVRRQRSFAWFVAASVVLFFALVVTVYAQVSTQGSGIALLVLLFAVVAAGVRPIWGVYAIVFFTLVGDGETAAWFPFAKNFSNQESLLYLSGALVISPLEVLVAMTLLFSWLQRFGDRRSRPVKGPVFLATAAFTAFVFIGFLVGVGRGGDARIALFEGRDLFLLLPIYALIVNHCDAMHLRRLVWTAVTAIFINSLFGLAYLRSLTPLQTETLEQLGEHPASVHFNVVILLGIILFLYGAGSRWMRLTLVAMTVPVGIVLLTAQRRAAIAALLVGVIIVVLSLWWQHRTKFLVIAPILLVGIAGYTAAFWNTTSSVGFPAQAVKSIVAEDQISEDDRGSDTYRLIENFDLNYTIRSAPLFGLGFGQKFYRPAELPDISFFEFYEYIPHNSILWIWIKTGFFGFVAMLLMFATVIRAGARSMVRSLDPVGSSFALVGVTYTFMFVVFAFVDIAWEPRSMVFLALSFALCSQSERTTPQAAVESDAQVEALQTVS